MKILKKICVWAITITLTLLLLLSGILIGIVKYPEKAWEIVQEHLLPSDLKIEWETMELQVKHLSGLSFYFDWKINGLHLKNETQNIDFPIDRIRLQTSVFPKNLKQKFYAHNWQVETAKTMRLNLKSQQNGAEKSPFQILQDLVIKVKNYREIVKIENVDISIKDFRFGKKVTFSFDVNQNKELDPETLFYRGTVKLPNDLFLSSQGHLSFSDPNSPILSGEITVSKEGLQAKQKFDLSFNDKSADIKLNGSVDYRWKEKNVSADSSLHLIMNAKGAEINFSSALKGIPAQYVEIDSFKGKISMPFENNVLWSDRPSHIAMSIPLKNSTEESRLSKYTCRSKIPKKIILQVKGKIWPSNLMVNPAEALPVLGIRLHFDEIDNNFISLNAAAHLEVKKKEGSYLFYPNLHSALNIYNFQGLKECLIANDIMIPAPLDVLDGNISMHIEGPLNTTVEGYKFPVIVKTNLTSHKQIVDIYSRSNIFLKSNLKGAKIDVHARINQLQLELPPLKLTHGRPRIIPDSRIVKKPAEKKKSTFSLDTSFEITTARPGAIRLLSEYFGPYLPLSVEIERTAGEEDSGFIRMESFDIVYLRRKVHVEKMLIDLSKADEKALIVNGRLRINQSFYTVYIDVEGTTSRPNIVLSSNPYLPRSEIISVLLYDRTSDQLISVDAETASHVEEAVADRAIGLFGIWAFAATPIKSFSYNPISKVYAATIALADDVTASVGTN